MIIEEIKNSVRDVLYRMDNNIIFHFEEAKTTGFPYIIFKIRDFHSEHFLADNKQKFDFSFELVYAKSAENKIIELINAQEQIAHALLPTIKVLNKRLTLDNPRFSVVGRQLIMNFELSLYTYETEDVDIMQTLDLTMKEDKNA